MRSIESPTISFALAGHRSRLRRNSGVAAVQAMVLAGAFAALPSSTTAQAFGGAVLIADGHILVGEAAHEREPGSVWVFAQVDNEWTRVARLGGSGAPGTGFGKALAESGNFVFVATGAPGSGEEYAPGSVLPYRLDRTASPVLEQLPWARAVTHNPDFGNVMAASGNLLLVSRGGLSGGLGMEVYRIGEDGDWSDGERFTVPESFTRTGTAALALGEALVVVGDPTQNAVHLFEKQSGDGGWGPAGTLSHPEAPSQSTFFGFSVALSGSEVLVGQLQEPVVHRYAKMDGAWQPVGTLEPENDEMRPGYGASLAVDGETLLVGGAQRFYEYRRSGDGWERTGASPPYSADGAPVARTTGLYLEDQVAVLADPSADFGLGAVTVFSRESGEWQHSARLVADHEPLPAISGGEVTCEDGEAGGYDCNEVDLLAFVPWEELGAARGARLNDVWGWTDPETGREYAIVCHMDGTSFVDVTDPYNPRYLGHLPKTEGSRANTWRDAKVYRNHAFVVADGAGEHGMQVFDLTRLRSVTEPEVFDADALYTEIASSHNVAINEATGFAYLVGSSGTESCGGGSHMVDINDPLNPVFAGCFAHPNTGRGGTGNSHDTQCVIYRGPDEDYRDREICVNSNETALSIADVTDKDNPVAVSSAAYPAIAYAHQGWLTEDHRYFYSNDELDEVSGLVEATRTLVWDLQDLDDPILITEYYSDTQATDHNLYIRGNRLYMTNNRAGLRVLDISDPENPVEVGHFDTTPWSDDAAGFDGTWSVYPFFDSGTVVISSRREGLFIVKPRVRPLIG